MLTGMGNCGLTSHMFISLISGAFSFTDSVTWEMHLYLVFIRGEQIDKKNTEEHTCTDS